MDKHDDKTRIQKHSLLVTDYEKTQVLINYQAKVKYHEFYVFKIQETRYTSWLQYDEASKKQTPFSTTEKLKNNQYSQKQQNSKDVTIN